MRTQFKVKDGEDWDETSSSLTRKNGANPHSGGSGDMGLRTVKTQDSIIAPAIWPILVETCST